MNGITRDAVLVILSGLLGVLVTLLLVATSVQANSKQHHTVVIGANGADPGLCVIDRNDSVAFFNATGEAFAIYLPAPGVNSSPIFSFDVEPGVLSKSVSWNLDNVNRWFEIDGERVANIRTTDDPPFGSCLPGLPYRYVVGGIARD